MIRSDVCYFTHWNTFPKSGFDSQQDLTTDTSVSGVAHRLGYIHMHHQMGSVFKDK